MSDEKKRKQPKIAWRALGKPEAPAAAEADTPKQPEVAREVAAPPAPAASPLAIAAALNAAPVAEVRPATPEPRVPAPEIHADLDTPLADPEQEVHRILARLASVQPGAPRRAVVEPVVVEAEPMALRRRGPSLPDEVELAPAIRPHELREAARTRKGRVELLLFRVGVELFALPLGAVEEAIESPEIASLPEMPAAMLGVFRLRGRLVPIYTPGTTLGVPLRAEAGAALMTRSGDRRLALAVDDVEDVMELELATLREPPVMDDADGILLGVVRRERELVSVLDAEALIAACIGGRTLETT